MPSVPPDLTRPVQGMRPARDVMSMTAAGAAVADALSFSRSAFRELVQGRWRIEKLRFDLDAEGRGEVLYRLTDGKWTFHFFLVALKLDEADKMDRNWAASWDAMGVLCQGEWTPEREALLREEVPKQRSGYADYDTLVYARGNRSARFFDHVVERLASGQQPDIALLARVGYLLRTTAFIANGQLGTRAYAGLEPDHPFRRPYHVQMASGFVLREYVLDLVDHVARARNPEGAVRLDPAYRRFLGIGNAAATGLISFVVNHPHLMHRWTHAREAARAETLRRAPDAATRTAFSALLARAVRYLRESADERTDPFATAGAVAADLERLQAAFPAGPSAWPEMCGWASRELGREAAEIALALVLELYPDLLEAARDAFLADERTDTVPAMRVEALRTVVRERYGWALGDGFGGPSERFFWYRAANTPRENRRGLRAVAPELQSENGMDTARQAGLLWRALQEAPAGQSVAEFLCARPDLRHIVARAQSLAASPYGELQVNWLAPDFSPFGPVRFVLAFYGMEKFEAALPKSVRGAFLQGAPLAEDVAQGRDGRWPYPVIPAAGSDPTRLDPLPPAGLGAVKHKPAPAARSALRIAPDELRRTIHSALQAHGAPWGVAEDAAGIVSFAHARGEPALAAFLAQCEQGLVPVSAAMTPVREGAGWTLDARGSAALVAAPAALDLACAHPGMPVTVRQAAGAAMLGHLALRCAERGHFGLVRWNGGHAAAGVDADGPWYAHGSGEPPAAHIAAPAPGEFTIVCLPEGARSGWQGESMVPRLTAWQQQGLVIRMDTLKALEAAAAKLFVPVADVPRLRPNEESDPLKVF